MKIIEFRAENIKNLKVVALKPDGTLNVITGKNGAGKSAVLDAIFMALTGKSIEQPIRNGEKKAEIHINLGDYQVKKVFTASGIRLEVLSAKGVKEASPQTLLNKILGKLSFDPLAFATMDKKGQRELLIKLVGLNLEVVDAERNGLYGDRSMINKEVKALTAQLEITPKHDGELPEEEVSISALAKEAEQSQKKREQHVNFESKRKNLQKQIAGLEEVLAEAKENLQSIIGEEPEPVELADIAEIRDRFTRAEETNRKIRANEKHKGIQAMLEEAQGKGKTMSDRIDELDKSKIDSIATCQFPLEGLSIDDEVVLYNDKPFAQLSTGEQAKVSTAIAMNLNPNLKIIMIREGSLLDDQTFKEVVAAAKEKDYQLWIEKVAEDNAVGIYLEDGQIKGK